MSEREITRVEFLINQLVNMKKMADFGDSAVTVSKRKHSDIVQIEVNTGLVVRRNATPKKPILLSLGSDIDEASDFREFFIDDSSLINNIEDYLKRYSEIALLVNGMLRWKKFNQFNAKLDKKNKIHSHPNASIYEQHYRTIFFNGNDAYTKGLCAFNGKVECPVFVNGERHLDVGQLVLHCSFVEDCTRTGVFHCDIQNNNTDKGFILPLDANGVQSLMRFRDAPRTKTGRKKPVLHWVSKYILRSGHKVAKHTRGLGSFDIDEWSFNIYEPETFNNWK